MHIQYMHAHIYIFTTVNLALSLTSSLSDSLFVLDERDVKAWIRSYCTYWVQIYMQKGLSSLADWEILISFCLFAKVSVEIRAYGISRQWTCMLPHSHFPQTSFLFCCCLCLLLLIVTLSFVTNLDWKLYDIHIRDNLGMTQFEIWYDFPKVNQFIIRESSI